MTLPPSAPTPAAVTTWLEPHQHAIWRYLRALGASLDEAADLLQETMLVGCRTAVPPADPAAARAFLRGIARNSWLQTRRWWHRRREREVADAVDELWLAAADHDGGNELVAHLHECLQLLQPRAQQALRLHYTDGLPWHDVSARIGLRPNGTKTLVQRARAALRTCIDRRTA